MTALLTCATSFAQSVSVQADGPGSVHATTTIAVTAVLTNLVVTGTLNPPGAVNTYEYDGLGTGFKKWRKPGTSWYIQHESEAGTPYVIYFQDDPISYWISPINDDPIGVYSEGVNVTGTPTVVYSYVTNYTPATASVSGTATP